MNNKVLIKLLVPELDQSFDIFIPVNEMVWKIKLLLLKSISELTGVTLEKATDYVLINKDNSKIYKNNDVIINTDIRNSSEIILIKPARQG